MMLNVDMSIAFDIDDYYWTRDLSEMNNTEMGDWIRENCDFDQLILEFYTPGIPDSGWVHVSYVNEEDNRKSILTASRIDGKTQYSVGLNA